MVSNIFYFHPENWWRFPFWRVFFLDGWFSHQIEKWSFLIFKGPPSQGYHHFPYDINIQRKTPDSNRPRSYPSRPSGPKGGRRDGKGKGRRKGDRCSEFHIPWVIKFNQWSIGGLGWWFGFLESPYERDCYLGGTLTIPNHQPNALFGLVI